MARVPIDPLDVRTPGEAIRVAVIEGRIHHRAPDTGKEEYQADYEGSKPSQGG